MPATVTAPAMTDAQFKQYLALQEKLGTEAMTLVATAIPNGKPKVEEKGKKRTILSFGAQDDEESLPSRDQTGVCILGFKVQKGEVYAGVAGFGLGMVVQAHYALV